MTFASVHVAHAPHLHARFVHRAYVPILCVCVRAVQLQLYDEATNVPASCKVFVEMPDAKHDDPMTDAEKTQLTAWVNARR